MATGRIGTTPVLRTRWSKEPAGGTTSLSGLDDYSVSLVYEVGYEAVYQNGALLSRGNDYTATNGTTITLTNATVAGDIIEVFANNVVPLTDTYSQSVADGKFVNNTIVDAKGDLIVGSAADTFTRLAVGSANQVLTVDSATTSGLKWADVAATNDYTLLNTGGTALSGATTITVNITAHNKLALRYEGTTTNTSSYIQLRFNSDSGANYYFSGLKLTGTTAGRDGSFGGNEFNMGRMGNSAINVVYTIAMVEGAKSTGYKPFYAFGNADGTTTNESFVYGGLYAGSSAITSISLISTSGNFDGGTLYIYGAN